jgi:hypothetical protein
MTTKTILMALAPESMAVFTSALNNESVPVFCTSMTKEISMFNHNIDVVVCDTHFCKRNAISVAETKWRNGPSNGVS